MDQDQRRYGRAATVLLVVLAAALASRRVIRPPGPTRAAPDTVSMGVTDDSIERYLAPVPAPVPLVSSGYVAGLTTDPFERSARRAGGPAPFAAAAAAPGSAAPRRSAWTLTAILITEARRAAVINEQLVGVGDALPGGGRVIAVERDHVVVATADGARRQLTLSAGGV